MIEIDHRGDGPWAAKQYFDQEDDPKGASRLVPSENLKLLKEELVRATIASDILEKFKAACLIAKAPIYRQSSPSCRRFRDFILPSHSKY